MSTKAAETHARMLAALIIGVGEIASVVRETLERDQLSAEDRSTLRASLATAIHGIATILEEARPGTGQALTQSFRGYPAHDATGDA